MVNTSKTIGTIEIECQSCGHNKSYRKIFSGDGSEFGVCMECGDLTYDEPSSGSQMNQSPMVECPYCHSVNTKKISTTAKVATVATFGIFGFGKATKQWHCKNCESDF